MPGPNVPFPPMEAQLVNELPLGDGWQYDAHGGTHGSPVGPLLHRFSRSTTGVGSRRAKPGFAQGLQHCLEQGSRSARP